MEQQTQYPAKTTDNNQHRHHSSGVSIINSGPSLSVKENSNVINPIVKNKKTRSRAGCFACRLRRKKCDEVHPSCRSCQKIGCECIWPEDGQGSLTKSMRETLKDLPKRKIEKPKKIKQKKTNIRDKNLDKSIQFKDNINGEIDSQNEIKAAGRKNSMKTQITDQPSTSDDNNASDDIAGPITNGDHNNNATGNAATEIGTGVSMLPNDSDFSNGLVDSKLEKPEALEDEENLNFVNYTISRDKDMVLMNIKNGIENSNGDDEGTGKKMGGDQGKDVNDYKETVNQINKNKDFANYLFNPTNINDSSLFLDKMFELNIQNEFFMTSFLNNNMDVATGMMNNSSSSSSAEPTNLEQQQFALEQEQPQSSKIGSTATSTNMAPPPLLPVTNNNTLHTRTSNIVENDTLDSTNFAATPNQPILNIQMNGANMYQSPIQPLGDRTTNSYNNNNNNNNSAFTAAMTDSNTQMDHEDDIYGLDEEQTEIIYGQLINKFETWQPTGVLLSQANERTNSIGSNDSNSVSNMSNSNINNTFASKQDLLLYYTFFNYFLPKVGPQPTLPELTTIQTFPNVEQNSIVNTVFKCCGATFLAWCQPLKYASIAEELYEQSKKNLKELSLTTITSTTAEETTTAAATTGSYSIKGDEDWLIACFQLLVLRDKLYNGQGVVDRCIDNLSHSFSIIQKRYLLDSSKVDIFKSPIDRMLLESFLYNYTVSVSVAKNLEEKLPNPFSPIITKLVSMLKLPLFEDCEVEWLNNPVLGSSVDVFIMLAKVSYLGRLELPLVKDSIWDIRATELLQQCLYYSPPSLPERVKADKGKYSKYRPGLLCGSIVSKACYLLLYKIINFGKKKDSEILSDPEIQSIVKYAIQALVDIEKDSKLLCILQWALLIIGAFTVDAEDKLVIREYVKSVGETIHSNSGNKIKDVLNDIWSKNNLNILFDRERLSQLVI